MDTNTIWETLGEIPVGAVVAWGAVIVSIIAVIGRVIMKLYGLFKNFHAIKEDDDKQKMLVADHDKMFSEMRESLEEIKHSLDEQRGVNLRQLRYTIVHTCDDALAAGCISPGKYKSLEELYEEYVVIFEGNGYVKALVDRVRQLPVVGKLDE